MPDPMNDRDIVVLFGAGASHGADYVLPAAPPLGVDLYDALATQYPTIWGPGSHIGRMWADKLMLDFERTMAEDVLPWVPSLNLLEWHRCVAQFFAGYHLSEEGQDCYSALLSGLMSKGLLRRTLLGTLNYDCLLEQAMARLRLNVSYMLDEFGSFNSIPLAKIHGSCNFVSTDLGPYRAQLTNANASSLECHFDPLPLGDLPNRLTDKFSRYERGFYPVLSLYSPYKPSILAPSKLQTLRNTLALRLAHATVVVIIGIKPNPQGDQHLWEPIAQSPAPKILYVGGNPDFAVLRTVQLRSVHSAETFADGVRSILSALTS
jgi:hypothetical protein